MSQSWADLPTVHTGSPKWRAKEARDIFLLMREEYENSKMLCFVKRYRELVRILETFTSEPIIQKVELLSRIDYKDSGRRDQTDLSSDCLLKNKARTVEDKTLNTMNRSQSHTSIQTGFTTMVRRIVPTVWRSVPGNGHSTRIPAPLSLHGPEITSPWGVSQDHMSVDTGYASSYSDSQVSLSANAVITPDTTQAFCFPCTQVVACPAPSTSKDTSLGAQSDEMHHNVRKVSGNHMNSPSAKLIQSQPIVTRSRRWGMEQNLVRNDQIPAFSIPSRSVVSYRSIDSSMPRTRLDSCSTFTADRHVYLRSIQSTPNFREQAHITSRQTVAYEPNGSSHRLRGKAPNVKRCYTLYKEEDFLRESHNTKLSMNVFESEMDEASIVLAIETLKLLKEDYKNLQGKRFFARYKKMKRALKACIYKLI